MLFLKLNSVCSTQPQYPNVAPMLREQSSQVLNVIGQHCLFPIFSLSQGKASSMLAKDEKQTMARTP